MYRSATTVRSAFMISLPVNELESPAGESSSGAARLGCAIKALREGNRLTLAKLAAQCDMSAPNLCKIEKGQAKGFTLTSLEAMTRALGIEVHELFAMAAGLHMVQTEALSAKEWELVQTYRKLSLTQREMLENVAGTLDV
jgi:transcriptional regulator with XRE-family HTH domain